MITKLSHKGITIDIHTGHVSGDRHWQYFFSMHSKLVHSAGTFRSEEAAVKAAAAHASQLIDEAEPNK